MNRLWSWTGRSVGRSGGLLFFILYNLYLTLRVFDFLVSCHGVDFLSAGVFGLRMKLRLRGLDFRIWRHRISLDVKFQLNISYIFS